MDTSSTSRSSSTRSTSTASSVAVFSSVSTGMKSSFALMGSAPRERRASLGTSRNTNDTGCRKEERMTNEAAPAARMGRPPATSHDELERIGLELFTTRGFEETTIDEIAAAAGISRRTFFRYYTSKNDLVWGNFDAELHQLRERLAAVPPTVSMMAALREAVVAFNRVDADHVALHRRRMALILGVPTLMAHSTLRFAGWRDVIAEFVG